MTRATTLARDAAFTRRIRRIRRRCGRRALPRLVRARAKHSGAGRGVGAPVVVEKRKLFPSQSRRRGVIGTTNSATTMRTRTTREDDERASDLAASRDRSKCKIDWRTRNRKIATEMRTITRQREERRTVGRIEEGVTGSRTNTKHRVEDREEEETEDGVIIISSDLVCSLEN